MSLTDFLLERIAEDEARAREVYRADEWHLEHSPWDSTASDALVAGGKIIASFTDEDAMVSLHVEAWSPARVLAECDAKRRLVDWSAPVSGSERVPTGRPGVYDRRDVRYVNEDGEDVLRYLALPYADHPDYREEWKP